VPVPTTISGQDSVQIDKGTSERHQRHALGPQPLRPARYYPNASWLGRCRQDRFLAALNLLSAEGSTLPDDDKSVSPKAQRNGSLQPAPEP